MKTLSRFASVLILVALVALRFVQPVQAADPNFSALSVLRYAPSGLYTNQSSVQFSVMFSEPVDGATVDVSDFAVASAFGAVISSVTPDPLSSGAGYFVTVGSFTAEGLISVNVLAGGINNEAGQPLLTGFSGGEQFNIDFTPPVVNTFTALWLTSSLDIPITSFGVSDFNSGVAGYLISRIPTPPAVDDSGWSASAPTTFHVTGDGYYILYPWAKDAAGNVSSVYGTPVTVFVDSTAPIVNTFTATTPSASLDIPITDFAAWDNRYVVGFLITESATTPEAGSPDWTSPPPTTFHVAVPGPHTLYPWARDAAGNVSAVFGSGVTVNVELCNIVVTNNADSGPGSLRQALADVCAGGKITFANSYTITLASQLTVNKAVTITGRGAAYTIIQASATPNTATQRVFEVTSAGNLTLNRVTVRNGRCAGSCGVTSGNSGGGILNSGTLKAVNSAFSGNSAGRNGGGIYNKSGAVTVINSVFSGNSATFDGGGIYNKSGAMAVTNSVFSANSAGRNGGGIFNKLTLRLINSTFSGNSAVNNGGGVYTDTGTLTLKNTILANSPSGGDCRKGSGAIATSHNLIEGIGANACGIVNGANGNIVGVDPKLGALKNNGGPTKTMALLAGSPALGAGDNAVCAAAPVNGKDQRGQTRPQGDPACDIGSFESGLLASIIAAIIHYVW
ncbi:MAG: hypothetical protein HY867_05150 [Chloroflexi bacterium]|nr:hypothetical protein [Chloroflexota bacterium]